MYLSVEKFKKKEPDLKEWPPFQFELNNIEINNTEINNIEIIPFELHVKSFTYYPLTLIAIMLTSYCNLLWSKIS